MAVDSLSKGDLVSKEAFDLITGAVDTVATNLEFALSSESMTEAELDRYLVGHSAAAPLIHHLAFGLTTGAGLTTDEQKTIMDVLGAIEDGTIDGAAIDVNLDGTISSSEFVNAFAALGIASESTLGSVFKSLDGDGNGVLNDIDEALSGKTPKTTEQWLEAIHNVLTTGNLYKHIENIKKGTYDTDGNSGAIKGQVASANSYLGTIKNDVITLKSYTDGIEGKLSTIDEDTHYIRSYGDTTRQQVSSSNTYLGTIQNDVITAKNHLGYIKDDADLIRQYTYAIDSNTDPYTYSIAKSLFQIKGNTAGMAVEMGATGYWDKGGVISGPTSGYHISGTAHGTEVILPTGIDSQGRSACTPRSPLQAAANPSTA